MAEEIKIDMDKPCQKCGVMGAAGNGLCISCTADNFVNWENLIGEALMCGNKEIYNLLASASSADTSGLPHERGRQAFHRHVDRACSIG